MVVVLEDVALKAGVVVARAVRVVDGDLEAVEADVLAGARLQGEGADEDAAVAALTDFEVEVEDEVAPRLVVDHHVAAALVRVDGAFFHGRATWLL